VAYEALVEFNAYEAVVAMDAVAAYEALVEFNAYEAVVAMDAVAAYEALVDVLAYDEVPNRLPVIPPVTSKLPVILTDPVNCADPVNGNGETYPVK
jgi:hypothetical protein